jgi:hypothetical protein
MDSVSGSFKYGTNAVERLAHDAARGVRMNRALTTNAVRRARIARTSFVLKFRNLRDARNAYAHTGTDTLGGTPVSDDQAAQLVQYAIDIVDWLEELLPDHRRWPRVVTPCEVTTGVGLLWPPDEGESPAADL